MNVLFVSDTRFTHTPFRDGATRYRCYHMAEALQCAGHLADVCTLESLDLTTLPRYDVVSVHRPKAGRKLMQLLERCQQRGIRTVADIDRLEFVPTLAKSAPSARVKNADLAAIRKAFMRRKLALQHFDEVSAATDELARMRRVQAPWQTVYVAKNGLSNYWLSSNDRLGVAPPAQQTIGYFNVGQFDSRDFAPARKAVTAFLDSRKSSNLLLLGSDSMDLEPINPAQIERSTWTDFMDMPRKLKETWVQVLPMHVSKYTRAKPATAFIESAAFGVPFVGTPSIDLAQHAVDGLYLADNKDAWVNALDELNDPTHYAVCQKQLYEYARDCCRATHTATELIERWSTSQSTGGQTASAALATDSEGYWSVDEQAENTQSNETTTTLSAANE